MTGREGFLGYFRQVEICSWQDGKDPLNSALPDVLAIAGASVLAFRKRTNRRPYPFRTFRMDGSKGKGKPSFERTSSRGRPVYRLSLDPVQDCRRLRETKVFQRLNRMACIDG